MSWLYAFLLLIPFGVFAQDEKSCDCIEFEIYDLETKVMVDKATSPLEYSFIQNNELHVSFLSGKRTTSTEIGRWSFYHRFVTLLDNVKATSSGNIAYNRHFPKATLTKEDQKVVIERLEVSTGRVIGDVQVYVPNTNYKYIAHFDFVLSKK